MKHVFLTLFLAIFFGNGFASENSCKKKTAKESIVCLESKIDDLNSTIDKLRDSLHEYKELTNIYNSNLSRIKAFEDDVKVVKSNSSKIRSIENDLKAVRKNLFPKPEWPHAVLCGSDWDAPYILHGTPHFSNGNPLPAWYVQVYPHEYRYIQFDINGDFIKRDGDPRSSQNCYGKSMQMLKLEKRALYFISD